MEIVNDNEVRYLSEGPQKQDVPEDIKTLHPTDAGLSKNLPYQEGDGLLKWLQDRLGL